MHITRLFKPSKIIFLHLILLISAGCASTQAVEYSNYSDPAEPVNRVFFNFNETIDKHVFKPVAEAYVKTTPVPARTAVTNFFNNLTYPNVILNDFLQGKWDQGIQDTLRFLYNSTIGIGGLFDISTGIDMPAHNEDFGQTLAVWGIEKSTYLYIPLVGPNTARDATNFVPTSLLNPLFYISSTILLPITALNAINTRANLLKSSSIRDEAALDSYIFTREAYLQQRDYLIHDNNMPTSVYEDIFMDEDDGMLIID